MVRLERTAGSPQARLVALVAAVVILVAGVAVAVNRAGDGEDAAEPAATTTTVTPGPATTAPAATAPVTTNAGPTPPTQVATTAATARTTTTRAGSTASTTTSRATTSTAPGTTLALPVCTPALFRSTVTSDHPAYRNGETVHVSARFENISGRACSYTSTQATSQVLTPAGAPLSPVQTLTGANDQNVPFAPGASQTFGSSWDVTVCAPQGTCLPGRYTMVIDVSPFGGGRVSFDVTAP
jgi:hypothetical protein